MAKILIIDDELDICQLLDRFLSRKGHTVQTASSGNQGMKTLRSFEPHLVISDFRLPDIDGLELLKQIRAEFRETKVIIMTGYSDIRMAVEVIKYGAYDYVTKPLFPEELLNLIQEALDDKEQSGVKPIDHKSTSGSTNVPPVKMVQDYLIGTSTNSKEIYRNISIVAPTNMSVMIFGETGTGKEYVAKEIHRQSSRKDRPFIAVDCGALPKDIAASEFFGHEKGAYTGAVQSRDGKFKLADGGTLFLDEIGNLSYEVQLKLLRVLQEQVITRVGGTKEFKVDVRILTATNENLKMGIAGGNFREDLYYRLNEFQVNILPIRNRPEDIETFADRFMQYASAQLGKEPKAFTAEAFAKMKLYSWPGNLRELRNVIKRAVLLSTSAKIDVQDLPEEIIFGQTMENKAQLAAPGSLKYVALEAEKERIIDVLAKTGNNKSLAARILDIDRKTLYNKLKTYNI